MATPISQSRPVQLIRQIRHLVERFAQVNWALADQAIVSGASFLTTVLIARFLGMEQFGLFALAWLGIYFAQNLQIATIIAPMMTIGAKQKPAERATYTGAMVAQQTVFACATSLIVYLGVQLGDLLVPKWQLGATALPLALLVFVGQFCDFLRRYFFVFGKPRTSFTVDATRYGFQAAALFLMFLNCLDCAVPTVLYVMAAAAVAGLVPGLWFFGPATLNPAVLRDVTVRHWSFSRWLLVSAIAQWSREHFVHTAVGALLGLAEVGALRAAQQLVRTINVPIQGFDNVVPMRAGAAFVRDGFGGLVDFIDGFMLRYQAAIAMALLVIAMSGDLLLTVIYGESFAGHGYLVAAYAGVLMIYLMRTTVITMLRAMETTSYEFYASVAGGAIVTVLAFPLVREFGIAGSMVALALFEGVVLLFVSLGLRVQQVRAM